MTDLQKGQVRLAEHTDYGTITLLFQDQVGGLEVVIYRPVMDLMRLIEPSSINKVSSVSVSSCSNTGSTRDDPHWTSRKNSLELIELSSINKVTGPLGRTV